jgi:hypothetical protein
MVILVLKVPTISLRISWKVRRVVVPIQKMELISGGRYGVSRDPKSLILFCGRHAVIYFPQKGICIGGVLLSIRCAQSVFWSLKQ